MKTRNVYMYWVGNERKLTSILRNLIHLHSTNGRGYKVHLITDKNIHDYVHELPVCFNELHPSVQATFLSVHVIYEYGGIWIDSNTLVLDTLDTLFDILDTRDGFFIRESNDILYSGVFGSNQKTPLMLAWKTKMLGLLAIHNGVVGRSDIGDKILDDMFSTSSYIYEEYDIIDGAANVFPITRDNCITEYIEKSYENHKFIVRDYQPFLVLVHSFHKLLDTKTEKEILDGNMPLNYFINKSIGQSNLSLNRINNGCHIYNYGTSDYISRCINIHETWEPNISNIFNTIISNSKHKSDNVIIDIGCNIGYFSLISAAHDNISEVYSIDGNASNIHMLSLSSYKNGLTNIKPIHKCIADQVSNFKPSNKDIVNKVGNIGGMQYDKTTESTDIMSTTIDKLIKDNNITNVLIMKIDIEGGELNSLKGALNTLKSHIVDNIIIEITPKFNNDSTEILNILRSARYNLYDIPNKECGIANNDHLFMKQITETPITNINDFVNQIDVQTNILAIKRSRYVILSDWLVDYITKEPYMFAKCLETLGWTLILLSQLDIENIKSKPCVVLCITYDNFDITQLKCDNVFIVYKIDDLYPSTNIRQMNVKSSSMIISPYQYLFHGDAAIAAYPLINVIPSVHVTYSAINSFYDTINLNTEPILKILVSGSDSDVYPLREFFRNGPVFKNYIDVLKHPSYDSRTHDIIDMKYYAKLNEYICCFTDASSYKYILLKVFEICSVGSLLLVDESITSELNKIGFYEDIHCITCNRSNVEQQMKWILDPSNRSIVDSIRLNGMNLVRRDHNTNKKATQVDMLMF